MNDADPRPPVDDLEYNDPAGWGFCEYCAFDVAIFDGRRVEHRRHRNGHDDAKCGGSGGEPVRPTPAEATPRQIVSFRKHIEVTRRRAYWQRQRFVAREHARRKIAEMRLTVKPDSVVIQDLATGATADITDSIIGPIRLDHDPELELEEDDGEERDRP